MTTVVQSVVTESTFRDLIVNAARSNFGECDGVDMSPKTGHTDEDPNTEAKKNYLLLEREKDHLYLGCERISPLYSTTRLLDIKSDRIVSATAFNDFIPEFKICLPIESKNNMHVF